MREHNQKDIDTCRLVRLESMRRSRVQAQHFTTAIVLSVALTALGCGPATIEKTEIASQHNLSGAAPARTSIGIDFYLMHASDQSAPVSSKDVADAVEMASAVFTTAL